MSFSKEVSEKALVCCGRCCCLCHKFCGVKIELHHIKQKADGGDDSFDNCIPLCFDCHAEVKSYNPHHPKGRQITESELKKHRDEWYKKKAETPTYEYNDELRQLDKDLFVELVKLLNLNSFMYFAETHNFAFPFSQSTLEALDQFCFFWRRPEYEFADSDIESIRAQLYELMKSFSELISCNTFPVGNGEFSVPDEWEIEQPERFNDVVSKLNSAGTQVHQEYCKLIRIGRDKLAIRITKYD